MDTWGHGGGGYIILFRFFGGKHVIVNIWGVV